ncbi:MAG: aminotransferase class III-fold pyridoxal phosphate-dependent enzyme [Rhizobiaceae bacterium]
MHTLSKLRELFPDGSNGEFGFPNDLNIIVERGRGAHVWDANGRRYVDCSLAFGAVLLGHADEDVNSAVVRAAAAGDNFGLVSTEMLLLAERLVSIIPCAEKVRFCTSGTEAMMYSIRLARAATGRPLIVKFEGAYHGATDIGCASLVPDPTSNAPAVTRLDRGGSPGLEAELLVAPFNDKVFIELLMAERGDEVAAIVVEPLHRCIPPAPGFLETLRALCDHHSTVLIFDEVVTGFRLALGGAQEYFGVTPDLAGYGKALGNGYPIGAVVGKSELMDLLGENRLGRDDYVWSVSTGGGCTIAAGAANIAIRRYSEAGFHSRLFAVSDELRTLIDDRFGSIGVDAQVLGVGPLLQIVLSSHPIRNSRDMAHPLAAAEQQLMIEAVRGGVLVNPLGTKIYLSAAHSDDDIEFVADTIADAWTSTGLGARTSKLHG